MSWKSRATEIQSNKVYSYKKACKAEANSLIRIGASFENEYPLFILGAVNEKTKSA